MLDNNYVLSVQAVLLRWRHLCDDAVVAVTIASTTRPLPQHLDQLVLLPQHWLTLCDVYRITWLLTGCAVCRQLPAALSITCCCNQQCCYALTCL
jgi:hypothetical protein